MNPSAVHADTSEIPKWRRCLLAASMFLCVASYGFLEPFVSLYLELCGMSRGEIGLVMAAGTGMALVIQPMLGRLSDRLDARRPLMLGAAFAAAAAYVCYTLAGGLAAFILLTILGVNAVTYLNTANAVLVGRISSEGSGRGRAGTFAAYRIWGSVGYVIVSLLIGWTLGRGLKPHGEVTRADITPVFLYGPLLFLLVGVVVLLLPDPKCRRSIDGETDPVDQDDALPASCEDNLKWFLRAYFLYIFAYTGCAAYISLYLRSLGATPFWITSVFAAGVVCEVLVMSRVGRLSDRVGRRPILAVAFLLMPLRLGLYALAGSPLGVLPVQMIHGVNFGIMASVAVTFVGDLCSESHRGAMQARMAATSGIAAAMGPALGGSIGQALGLRWTFVIMACFAIAGAGIFLWKVRETHHTPHRLHRRAPAVFRPLLRVLCVPIVRLVRLRRISRIETGE